MSTQHEIGTVSAGTLRTVDLIPAFERELGLPLSDLAGLSAEDLADRVDDLVDRLNDVAPAGCYFGAHWGDGADFGFWPAEGEE